MQNEHSNQPNGVTPKPDSCVFCKAGKSVAWFHTPDGDTPVHLTWDEERLQGVPHKCSTCPLCMLGNPALHGCMGWAHVVYDAIMGQVTIQTCLSEAPGGSRIEDNSNYHIPVATPRLSFNLDGFTVSTEDTDNGTSETNRSDLHS